MSGLNFTLLSQRGQARRWGWHGKLRSEGKDRLQSWWGARTTDSDRDRVSAGIQSGKDFRVTPPVRAWPIGLQRRVRSYPIRSGECALRSTASREGPAL